MDFSGEDDCLDGSGREEEMDRFIGKLGFTVSVSDGNEVKLYNFLRLSRG